MIKSIAFLFILMTAAVSQSNPLIPPGISAGCTDFLTKLNSDSPFRACTRPLIAATAPYSPSSNPSPVDPVTISSMTSVLSLLCSPATTSNCPDSLVRGKIADFYGACAPELTSTPNKDVTRTYDVLYALVPMKQAICSKDDNGQYCVTEISKNVSSSGPKNLAVTGSGPSPDKISPSDLWISTPPKKREAQAALYPNTTTYSSTNLPFFFLSPDLPKEKLCVPCTRSILTSYTNFESSIPYAPGLRNSPILNGQPKLYAAVQKTCDKAFLGNNVPAAGGMIGGVIQGGASRTTAGELKGEVTTCAVVLAALGFVVF